MSALMMVPSRILIGTSSSVMYSLNSAFASGAGLAFGLPTSHQPRVGTAATTASVTARPTSLFLMELLIVPGILRISS